MRERLIRWPQDQQGKVGKLPIIGLLISGILAFVLYLCVAEFWPQAQSANEAIQAVSSNDTGVTTSQTFFGMGLWIIPMAIFIVLLIILITGMIVHRKK
jgi:ABC-type antimicrobial peptide transport system permease subunit